MKKRKIYVLGNGLLGNYVFSYLQKQIRNVVQITRSDIDFVGTDFGEFGKNNPFEENSIIVNCIGVLKPVIEKVGLDATVKLNKNLPILLEKIGYDKGINVINFSSDCVFSGKKGEYTELDYCDATDAYALTKTHDNLNMTVIRTSFIGHELKGKIGLLEFALNRSGCSINGYTNCIWNGVTALQLSKCIDNMIENDYFWSGIQHVFSREKVSKYDLIRMINEIYKLNLKITPVEASDIMGSKINGKLDRSLSSIHPMYIQTSLSEQIEEMKEYKL